MPPLPLFKIEKGWCEDVWLDDLAVVGTFYFPRALHHGQGVFQPILDERADEAQRNALFYILSGEDQPVGTMFPIFSVVIETIKDTHDPRPQSPDASARAQEAAEGRRNRDPKMALS